MQEKEINTSKKIWPYTLSKYSLKFAVAGWLFAILLVPISFFFGGLFFSDLFIIPIVGLSRVCIFVALIVGLSTAFKIVVTKSKIDNKKHFFAGLILSFIYLFLAFIVLPSLQKPKDGGPGYARIMCMNNMKQFSVSCLIYQEDNNLYPNKQNWCDLLKPYLGVNDEEQCGGIYLCHVDKTGPCSYAMNQNIPADAETLPEDLVVLFESAPGWNQVGGVDDVVTDRHEKPGANIAFANGGTQFVSAEEIPTLRWTVEDKSTERK